MPAPFREDQEISMLSLDLLQNCMAYVNTLMLQQILAQPHARLCTDNPNVTATYYTPPWSLMPLTPCAVFASLK